MPYYTFRNTKTKKEWTDFMSVSERTALLESDPDIEQIPVSATPTLDSVRLGVTKPPADFTKHVLGRMKEAIPNNTIGKRHFDIAREV